MAEKRRSGPSLIHLAYQKMCTRKSERECCSNLLVEQSARPSHRGHPRDAHDDHWQGAFGSVTPGPPGADVGRSGGRRICRRVSHGRLRTSLYNEAIHATNGTQPTRLVTGWDNVETHLSGGDRSKG